MFWQNKDISSRIPSRLYFVHCFELRVNQAKLWYSRKISKTQRCRLRSFKTPSTPQRRSLCPSASRGTAATPPKRRAEGLEPRSLTNQTRTVFKKLVWVPWKPLVFGTNSLHWHYLEWDSLCIYIYIIYMVPLKNTLSSNLLVFTVSYACSWYKNQIENKALYTFKKQMKYNK